LQATPVRASPAGTHEKAFDHDSRFSAEFVAFLGATFLPADAQRAPMPWTVSANAHPARGRVMARRPHVLWNIRILRALLAVWYVSTG